MTEADARAWIVRHFGNMGLERMEQLVAIIVAEASRQNLIAPSTLGQIWNRHVVDSAQLLLHAPPDGLWVDIGSGAGFPGLVVAALSERVVYLVEPRRKRADFLLRAVHASAMADRVHVVCDHVQGLQVDAAVISARAVAPLVHLFELGSGCASSATRWILPKGRSAREELETARHAWKGVFHVEHSITDPESLIVLASGVVRR